MIDYQNSPLCVIACDPGKSGAVVRLGQGRLDVRRDFKTLPAIAEAVRELSEGLTHAVMEDVHAMPGQGVCSMFSFGRAAGVADGAFCLCLPKTVQLHYVTPQKWQNFIRETYNCPRPTDFNSPALALAALPQAAPFLTRVLDHNTADALLMAVWRLSNPEMESPRPVKARGRVKRRKP